MAEEELSLAARIARSRTMRRRLATLADEDAEALATDGAFFLRPKQCPPDGEWRVWLLLAGRGFGKTRSGAEWVRARVEAGLARRVALVAPTAADARDVMIEGESGLRAIAPPLYRPRYEPSLRRLTWPNGAIATAFSADEPDRLRGPQHDAAWCDELAAWRYDEAFDNLLLGLRLGQDPRCVVTTTPRPIRRVRRLVASDMCIVTRGSTWENRDHLAPAFLDAIARRYVGTQLGRQELEAELLDDTPGALWTRALFEREGVRVSVAPELQRIVVAIDPAASVGEDSDETGIIVAGLSFANEGYVLDDLSGRFAPTQWAERAIAAYRERAADRIVGEVNNGGDMIEAVLRTIDPAVAFKAVRASRGKAVRAEPILSFYERGKVHHVGAFPALEDQLCSFTGARQGPSPDRLDALVWALTELMVEARPDALLEHYRRAYETLTK